MITTDEKRWPWRSSDVIKEGMLASTELLSVFNKPQHTLRFTNSVSFLDAMFCLQSQ